MKNTIAFQTKNKISTFLMNKYALNLFYKHYIYLHYTRKFYVVKNMGIFFETELSLKSIYLLKQKGLCVIFIV